MAGTATDKDDDDDFVDVTIKNEQGQEEKVQISRELVEDKNAAEQQAQADAHNDDPDDDDDGDSRLDADAGDDGATNQNLSPEQQREARKLHRKRRKLMQRRAKERSEATIIAQNKMIQDLNTRLSQIEGSGVAQTKAQIEQAHASSQRQFEAATMAMQVAMANGDTAAFTTALNERDAALMGMNTAKQHAIAFNNRITQAKNQASQQQRRVAAEQATVPMRQHYAAFIERNDFFDPEDENDPVTKEVDKIDAQIAEEGWDPNTPSYWAELQRRINTELKPKLTGLNNGAQQQQTQERPQNRNGGGPRMSGGRTSTGKNITEKHLTPARVAALKELGVDFSDKKQLSSYLKYFIYHDNQEAERKRARA